MRPTTVTVQTVSTIADHAQVMGIDADGMATILSILSNMYSDGALAVVREYSSNALDSHVEAGNPDPILITSPSHFNPVFTVQDFGTGLSRDEVLNVYAMYGASTKRDTNEQIGAFGIGAKSAFTVGTQFTVTAVKDGMETIALFALNDDGAPTVNILSHQATLEPNGVRVEVGVRDVDGVIRAIDRLFPVWQPGTVMVDGVEPASIWCSLSPMADDVHISWRENQYEGNAWTVVMGGIPYEMPQPIIDSLGNYQRQLARNAQSSMVEVFLTVPIGAVDITPSREELRVTDKTTTVLNELVSRFGHAIPGWVTEQISGAESRIGAMVMLRQLRRQLGSVASAHSGINWRGLPISNVGPLEIPDAEWFMLKSRGGGRRGHHSASRNKELRLHPSSNLEQFLFVTDVPERRVRSVQIAAKPFLISQNGPDAMTRVVALTQPASTYAQEWFDLADPALSKMPFDTFLANWKPVTTPAQRGVTTYDVHDEVPMTAVELNDAGPIYVLAHYERSQRDRYGTLIKDAISDSPLVTLKATQKWEVLTKKVPESYAAWPKAQDHARKLLDGLSQDEVDASYAQQFMSGFDQQTIKFLIANRKAITNQSVLDVIDQYERAQTLQRADYTRMELLRQAASALGQNLADTGKSSLNLADWKHLAEALPLMDTYFDRSYRRTSQGDLHVIDYINSIKI